MSTPQSPAYPVTFSVDYPTRPLNRVSTAFRIIWVLPVAVVVMLIGGANTAGVLTIPLVLMLLFRQKYPRWWFDWNINLIRFANRVGAYLLLLRDDYPSTDDEQAVHFDMPHPAQSGDVNRWLPLVKWILAIPHYVVLLFLWIAALFVVIVAWFAILFTGKYPRALFNFVVGVMRWENRVIGYAFALVTDRYPPFRLAP